VPKHLLQTTAYAALSNCGGVKLHPYLNHILLLKLSLNISAVVDDIVEDVL